MDKLLNWKEISFNSLNYLFSEISQAIPKFFGALLTLLIGWIFIRITLIVLKKVLKFFKIDELSNAINTKNLLGKLKFKIDLLKIILNFIKWSLYLVLLIIIFDVLKWETISKEVGNLLRYIPKFVGGIFIFMLGLYIANFLKNAIKNLFESFDLMGSKIISNLVFYVIAILISVTALNQMGIDTQIITNNVTLIFATFLASVALAFGLGAREIIADILRSYYVRKNYEIGQEITFDTTQGVIEAIDNITITIKTPDGKLILPIKEFSQKRVLISPAKKQ